jgi:exopolysaccharide biosynthesis polyprenyl glycosylphosphotransferase
VSPLVMPLVPRAVMEGAGRRKLLLVASDLGCVAVAMSMALLVANSNEHISLHRHIAAALLSMPCWIFIFAQYRLYNTRSVATRLEELVRLVHAVVASAALTALIGLAFHWQLSRVWLVTASAGCFVLLVIERELYRRWFTRRRTRRQLLRPTVIVGDNAESVALSRSLVDHPELGYEVIDLVSAGCSGERGAHVEPVSDVVDTILRSGGNTAILVTTGMPASTVNRLARDLHDRGLHVEMTSGLEDIAPGRLTVRSVGRYPVFYIEPTELSGWRAVAKRIFDIIVAGAMLLVTLPMWVVISLAIKLTSRGPIFFRQVRAGRDGQAFVIYKFRTMVTGAHEMLADLTEQNESDGPLFKIRDDPRVTKVGSILRSYSLDEIPQVLNVLKGDMSIVGPRPALFSEMTSWSSEQHNRLRVKPGITGMWQVSGRSDLSFADYVRLDLYYVDNWSLASDLAILAKTIPTVMWRRGAY